ncbi:MAG: hypothetical protein KA369_05935 [Spirochaetes bacterium]|nr:hypothetical protein [Spirochaetota bacterium]
MKFHIDEISHLAQEKTKYIKKLDIIKDKTVEIRISYIPIALELKYYNFNNGIMVFEITGNKIKRGLVRATTGLFLKKYHGIFSRILSVSDNTVFFKINDFLNNEIPVVKGILISGFDIVGKEVILHIIKKDKRKK